MQIRTLLIVSLVLRVCLIGYGEAQDHFLSVKYTDVDYKVFTDAARYVTKGESPFLRSTYRYTPLLAYLLVPNILFSHVWGKLLFASADIAAACQIWRIGKLQQASTQRCFWSIVLWLYNPFTVTISTRGSCDSVITVLLLAVLELLLQGKTVAPAILYGLAVHSRIYPIIYAPAIVWYLVHRQLQQHHAKGSQTTLQKVCNWLAAVLKQGMIFGGISGGIFLLLGLLFYLLYGQHFLDEAFLHHLVRKDPRHNFSIYYYPVYLDFMPWTSTETAAAAAEHVGDVFVAAGPQTASSASAGLVPNSLEVLQLLPFLSQWLDRMFKPVGKLLAVLPSVEAGRYAALPQATLLLVFAFAVHRQQPLCWLLQTMAFVAFNKVSTAQYFVWYYSLLPVALQQMPWPPSRALVAAGVVWVLAQLHWLFWGYLLEFKGYAVHLWLWLAGAVFLVANTAFMWVLLGCYRDGSSIGSNAKPKYE